MITTLTLVFVTSLALTFGIGIGVFIAHKQKKRIKEGEPAYEDLYREASSRLKVMMTEQNGQYSMQGSMTEQIIWHKNMLERVILKYEIKDDDVYNLVKETNDSMGIPTPTKEEMEQSVEKLMKSMGMEEQLNEYKKLHEEDQPTKVIELDIDSILDKVSKTGVESLTDQEKEFLNSQK